MRLYTYQPETLKASQSLTKMARGTVAEDMHIKGMGRHEPLIVLLDALIAYAKRHEAKFGSKLAEDYLFGPEWKNAAEGVRALLNGDGDFDGGACEDMFWKAFEIAGFTEADLGVCDCGDAREAQERRELAEVMKQREAAEVAK